MEFPDFKKLIQSKDRANRSVDFKHPEMIKREKAKQKLLSSICEALSRLLDIEIDRSELSETKYFSRLKKGLNKNVIPGISVEIGDNYISMHSVLGVEKKIYWSDFNLMNLELSIEQFMYHYDFFQYSQKHNGEIPSPKIERQFSNDYERRLYASKVLDQVYQRLASHPLVESIDIGWYCIYVNFAGMNTAVFSINYNSSNPAGYIKFFNRREREVYDKELTQKRLSADSMLKYLVTELVPQIEFDLKEQEVDDPGIVVVLTGLAKEYLKDSSKDIKQMLLGNQMEQEFWVKVLRRILVDCELKISDLLMGIPDLTLEDLKKIYKNIIKYADKFFFSFVLKFNHYNAEELFDFILEVAQGNPELIRYDRLLSYYQYLEKNKQCSQMRDFHRVSDFLFANFSQVLQGSGNTGSSVFGEKVLSVEINKIIPEINGESLGLPLEEFKEVFQPLIEYVREEPTQLKDVDDRLFLLQKLKLSSLVNIMCECWYKDWKNKYPGIYLEINFYLNDYIYDGNRSKVDQNDLLLVNNFENNLLYLKHLFGPSFDVFPIRELIQTELRSIRKMKRYITFTLSL